MTHFFALFSESFLGELPLLAELLLVAVPPRPSLQPAILELLKSIKGCPIEGIDDSLILYFREKELKPAQYLAFQENARKIAALFPPT